MPVKILSACRKWTLTSFCFLQKTGSRKRCAACKVIAHQKCIEQLERINQIKCRLTFREATPKGDIIVSTHFCLFLFIRCKFGKLNTSILLKKFHRNIASAGIFFLHRVEGKNLTTLQNIALIEKKEKKNINSPT